MLVPSQKNYEDALKKTLNKKEGFYASICQGTCMGNCKAPISSSITDEVKKRLFA